MTQLTLVKTKETQRLARERQRTPEYQSGYRAGYEAGRRAAVKAVTFAIAEELAKVSPTKIK